MLTAREPQPRSRHSWASEVTKFSPSTRFATNIGRLQAPRAVDTGITAAT